MAVTGVLSEEVKKDALVCYSQLYFLGSTHILQYHVAGYHDR